MIGRIHGTLIEVVGTLALVDVGGPGYEVELTSGALAALGGVGKPCTLYTHHVVREDAQSLFGFANRDERDLFRTLIKLNGVGPKLALAVLSSLSLSDLAAAVERNEVARLTKVPGVGKRTAERLIIELKDKLSHIAIVTPLSGAAGGAGAAAMSEALQALISLGYKPHEAERVLAGVPKGLNDAEDIVRAALKGLAQSAAS